MSSLTFDSAFSQQKTQAWKIKSRITHKKMDERNKKSICTNRPLVSAFSFGFGLSFSFSLNFDEDAIQLRA